MSAATILWQMPAITPLPALALDRVHYKETVKRVLALMMNNLYKDQYELFGEGLIRLYHVVLKYCTVLLT